MLGTGTWEGKSYFFCCFVFDGLEREFFIFSKSDAKDFIAKAAAVELNNEVTNKINFDLEFSNKTISLGRLNLSEQINN